MIDDRETGRHTCNMRSIPVIAIAILAIACGGNVAEPGVEPGSDAGSDTIGGADATPDAAMPDVAVDASPVPLDNFCAALADARCNAEGKACCERSTTFKPDGCRAAVMTACARDVVAAQSGRATFDATKVGVCVAAWKAALMKCELPLHEKKRLTGACGAMFKGTIMPGQPCTTSVECIAPEGAAGWCLDNKCTAVGVTALVDAGCLDLTCEVGLYCDVLGGAVCRRAIPPGGACSADAPMSCGYGFSCIDGHCVEGKPAGASCSTTTGEGWDCASWDCRVATQKCAPFASSIAVPEWCNGS